MANTLQIKNRIAAVKTKMKTILRTIARRYEQGDIKSPAELQHTVYTALESFYASIGKSVFQPIYAWGPPYSADHNQMIDQIHQDILTLYEEAMNMTQDLANNFEQVELERQSFENRILKLQDALRGIDINLNASMSRLIFRDHFVDHDHYAKDMAKETPAHLSASEGLLTLARMESETFNDYATITIQEGNGFPGNTHIVRSMGDTLKFDGQEELHINLADILDGNADTWFEYEGIEIPDRTEDITEGKGFEYKEGIEWAWRNERDLTVKIQIELTKPKTMNWISLSPFIPSDKGAVPARIESLVINDGKGEVRVLGQNEVFDSEKGFLFPRQECKTITLHLTQTTAYETDIGHLYFKQMNKDQTSVVGSNQQEGVRVHGPAPSITQLGVAYDSGSKTLVYPVQSYGNKIEKEEHKKEILFSTPPTDPHIQAGMERVRAWRYVIGLRDTTLASYQFEPVSEYVSKPFYTTAAIKEVELEVDADIPAIFPQDREYLEYFISIDQGQNWHPIYPRNTYSTTAKTKYLINSGIPKEGRLEEIGYLESLVDIHEVQVRILLRRPNEITDAPSYTPILYGYELHVATHEGVNL